MDDQDKTKEQLVAELAALRQRVGALEPTEKSLRESEERYHTLVEVVPQLLGRSDANRETVEWNQRWYQYTGQTPAEARGLGWLNALHPDDVAWTTQRISETRATGELYEVEYRVRRNSDGAYRWHLARSMPIKDKDGRITGWFGSATDIDDQKRAEAALRESEQRFRKVFEEGPIGVVLVSTDGRIQRANRCFCEMLGCAESEIIAVGLAGISRPDDWERDYPFVSRLWRGEISSYHAEKRYLRKDGQVVWTQLMVSLMHDEAGRPINSIGMVEDITERKQVEEALKKAHNELERRVQERTAELAEANQWLQREVEERKAVEADLRESEEKYKTLVETSPDAVILADLTGHATFVSSRFLEIYGAETADEVMGKTAWDNIAPEDHEKGRVYFQKTLEDGITRGVEYTFIRKDGTRIPVELSAALVKDASGKPMAIISVLRDITERKRAEEQLARLAGIVESSQDGIIGGTPDGVVIAWNAGAERLYGYTAEEAIGQQIRFLVSPDRPDETVELRARIARGEVLEPYETVRRRKDGTLIDVSMTSSPIRNGGGRIVGVSSIARDITERRRAEEALQREHRTLRHLLESSDHERQLIAYEIHDGLAQYLAGAIMQFDVYKHLKETKPKNAAKAYDAGVTMLRQGHSEARRLISGLRPPILDEEGIVAAIAHLVNEERRKKGPKIEYLSMVEFERLTPILENSVYRTVQEALTNACRHSQSKKVRVELVQYGDQLRIDVRDQGVGFCPEDVKEGQFGLAGIRERARLLGGKATIESKVGKGSRIVVELPIVLRRDEDDAE